MKRSLLLYFLILASGLILLIRLFQIQIIKAGDYNPILGAEVKFVFDDPERGYVYDRNGKLLVANQLSYDVMIIPNEVVPLDTLEFCRLLKIDKEDFKKRFQRAEHYAPYLPYPFLKQLAKEDYAYLQEKMHRFQGFYIQKRIIRDYPTKSAANVLGYISEVDQRITKNDDYYEQGDLIGKAGIEQQYEKVLRGKKGKKYLKRDRFNKITGSYMDGKIDSLAVNGQDLTLTLDSELQQYGEHLMRGKRGGIVALEPSSGEILALITAPSYDPNDMVGRKRARNSTLLFHDSIHKPMFDRGLKAYYSPGSPFKLFNALVGLQEGVIDTNTSFYCYNGYQYGKRQHEFMGCHCGIYGKPIRLNTAIAKSCNSYFANTYKRIIKKNNSPSQGMNQWNQHIESFGLGNFLGYDLPQGKKGLIPDGSFYDKKNAFRWNASTNISNAIGQGEIITTPIQLANATAAIANRGHFYTPHIVKSINNIPITDSAYTVPKKTTIKRKFFEPVINGMEEVFKTGTGKYYPLKGVDICGKTGTVENFITVNGKKKQLVDHSILVAFAPKENPKIVLAVFIENGGYGSTFATPIASLMIEKYLKGNIERKWIENSMVKKDLYPYYLESLKPSTIETGTD